MKGGQFTNNNQVELSGRIETEFMNYIESHNEKFFKFFISIERASGAKDEIPVVISERLINVHENCIGMYVRINGEFRSYNAENAAGNKNLLLYIFPKEIEFVDRIENTNDAFLVGFICKKPTRRTTPFGREISDVILAVNRNCGKSDYIPCVIWGRNASYAASLDVGTCISICGRIQSREYIKNDETRTAYEVSVSSIEVEES